VTDWPGAVAVRIEAEPAWPLTLPGVGLDGLWRRVGAARQRLLHAPDGTAVVVRVAQPAARRIVIGARADTRDAAAWGVERMRLALGVDDDLRAFHDAFAFDPLIGASVRGAPGLRPRRTPTGFQALAWAVTEQLIEFRRAVEIQRAMTRRFGRRCAVTRLRDAPSAAALAGAAPAEIEACGLAASRALALRRAAQEVAAGRVDLDAPDGHEAGWARLRRIPGIGSWTLEVLATAGQGRFDQLPAGDLAYVVLVARLQGRRERATEDEVRAFFARFAPWQALAGLHALRASGAAHLGPAQGLAA
jgi:3-methyladenine DNA glycosylase/8-oxoguanine DNA glycosylase